MTLDPMLNVLMQQARGDLAAQVMQVRRARSLREVVQHMEPQVSPMLRSVMRTMPEARQLQAEAERRADQLIVEQLAELGTLSGDALEKRVAHLRRQEWNFLRGNFPRQAMYVGREATRVLDADRQKGVTAAP